MHMIKPIITSTGNPETPLERLTGKTVSILANLRVINQKDSDHGDIKMLGTSEIGKTAESPGTGVGATLTTTGLGCMREVKIVGKAAWAMGLSTFS